MDHDIFEIKIKYTRLQIHEVIQLLLKMPVCKIYTKKKVANPDDAKKKPPHTEKYWKKLG